MDRLQGVMKADPSKRYKNFITAVADNEEVWLLENEEGYATIDMEGFVNIIVYPQKEDAEYFAEGDTPVCIDVYEFLDRCREVIADESIQFAVYPNNENVMLVTAEGMIEDLTAELELYEMEEEE